MHTRWNDEAVRLSAVLKPRPYNLSDSFGSSDLRSISIEVNRQGPSQSLYTQSLALVLNTLVTIVVSYHKLKTFIKDTANTSFWRC
jgi:hypothetical protein